MTTVGRNRKAPPSSPEPPSQRGRVFARERDEVCRRWIAIAFEVRERDRCMQTTRIVKPAIHHAVTVETAHGRRHDGHADARSDEIDIGQHVIDLGRDLRSKTRLIARMQ